MLRRMRGRVGWLFSCAAVVAWSVTLVRADPADVQPAGYARPRAQEHATNGAVDARLRLVRQLIVTRRRDPALPAQLLQLTADLPVDEGAAVFEELAEAHAQAGDFNEAAEVCRTVVDRYAEQPAALDAARWLLALYGSSEVALAQSPQHVPDSPTASDPQSAEPVGAAFAQYALGTAERMIAKHQQWGDDPPFVLARAAAGRKLQGAEAVNGWLRPIKQRPVGDAWGDAARMESWLLDPRSEQPPKAIIACPLVEPPTLDGQLTDACWRVATPLRLGTLDPSTQPAPQPAAEVRLARDAEYLYVAITAPGRPAVANRQAGEAERTHDSADRNGDHVRILLDLDRDYATWFELIVDARGHTADSAWTDAAWNPEWFVAARADAQTWYAEAAVPWSSITAAPPVASEAWAVAIERLHGPSGVARAFGGRSERLDPDAFGVLRFE